MGAMPPLPHKVIVLLAVLLDRLESKVEVILNQINEISGVKSAFNYGHDLIGYHGVLSGVDWREGKKDNQINFREGGIRI